MELWLGLEAEGILVTQSPRLPCTSLALHGPVFCAVHQGGELMSKSDGGQLKELQRQPVHAAPE